MTGEALPPGCEFVPPGCGRWWLLRLCGRRRFPLDVNFFPLAVVMLRPGINRPEGSLSFYPGERVGVTRNLCGGGEAQQQQQPQGPEL